MSPTCAASFAFFLVPQAFGPDSGVLPEALVLAGPDSPGDSALGEVLAASGRFHALRSRPLRRELDDLPRFKRFQVLLFAGGVADASAEELRTALRPGAGLVVLHPGDSPLLRETFDLVSSPRTEDSSDPLDYAVEDRSHPITRALEDFEAHVDTLDCALVPDPGGAWRTLALRAPPSAGEGPWLAARETDGRRLVYVAWGHDARALDPALRALLVRACEWAALGDVAEGGVTPNHLTPWERRAGWRALFDGATLEGWHVRGRPGPPGRGWSVAPGELVLDPTAAPGDLVSDAVFTDFELEFEFWFPPGGDGGVLYRLRETDPEGRGLEYQILDDGVNPERLDSRKSAGALYGLREPIGKAFAPPGRWHRGRIVSVGDRIEHWLDGRRVLAAELDTSDAVDVPTSIALQDHGDAVRFRSLYLRDLLHPPGTPVALFDGHSLAGWRAIGDAAFEVEDGAILGRSGGGGQSFLVTQREFADFVLELEVRTELPGNSGIQVRSHVDESGRVFGYQIEVDPSDRSWSGGLYDEARAGWLQTLAGNEQGRGAFEPGEWNLYRIECVGPTLRAWVNGIPTTHFAHHADSRGVIGLQVHAGGETRVRFRNLRLWELPG